LLTDKKAVNTNYIEIPAIGDGNCSVNAFALGLIDLIHSDREFKLAETSFNVLIQKIRTNLNILEKRLKLYQGRKDSLLCGNAYVDLVEPLFDFINFIKVNATIAQALFFEYILSQKSRLQVAALHVALAPALRDIGASQYQILLTNISEDMRDAELLMHDGVEAGEEILNPLALFFGIHLTIIDEDNHGTLRLVEMTSQQMSQNQPNMAVIHIPGHWNYIMPTTQKNGLAELLPSILDATNDHVSASIHTIFKATSNTAQLNLRKPTTESESGYRYAY
jgi:hypothetical protein